MQSADLYLDLDAAAAARSQMSAFMRFAAERCGRSMTSFADLQQWACAQYREFWGLFLEHNALPTSGLAVPVCTGDDIEHARFFPHLQLNYAQVLLDPKADTSETRPAVIWIDESGNQARIGRALLRRQVLSVAAALVARGLRPGDRAVAIARNSVESLTACLACASIGVAWSSVAPDLGAQAVIDRFAQLQPRIVFADLQHTHHGVTHSLEERVGALLAAVPSIETVVLLSGKIAPESLARAPAVLWPDLLVTAPLEWQSLAHFPFDHPLFILFSSGTTGAPKCIMHGAGGTLLEHLKEHRLHGDLSAADTLYFQTSCGWMMWNWQLSALASGATIVLYDGSVSFPDARVVPRLIDAERITVFGTSPAYLQLLKEAGIRPREIAALSTLRAILSTGSILYPEMFDWVGENFARVPLQSISGGTDMIGCLVLGNPLLPVYRGESQCTSLGIDVRARANADDQRCGQGDLVCVNPFPSRPIGFFGDPTGERLHASYFAEYPGCWSHGDRIELLARGSARILGRTDGTMKIRGVRIGPAEIYSVIVSLPGVKETMAVEQRAPLEPGGSRIVLLLVLAGKLQLNREFTLMIKRTIAKQVSPVHVPAVIAQVSQLPQTLNGKYSERAARDAVNGRSAANLATLRNPECLEEIAAHPAIALPAPVGRGI